MRAVLKKALVSMGLALGAATLAVAAPDVFHIGDGQDGSDELSSTDVINAYAQLMSVSADGKVLDVSTKTGFAANDLVMVIQMTGLSPAPAAGSSPVTLGESGVGTWELARVQTVSTTANQLTLTEGLVNAFPATGVQVVKVPEYQDLTIPAGVTIAPPAWNGSVGGVLAFLVSGQFTNNGVIDATGKGFRGGASGAGASGGGTHCTVEDEAGTGPK
ncbi:adhesin, partial [Pyxidicoccus fallax]|nr:adhesin [Pyxidicoccus fallax]